MPDISTEEAFSGARILVIDDESVLRRTLVAYLEDSDFVVDEAQNGREGLEQCQRCLPDLILCDLMMPEMDGLAFLTVAAQDFPEIPVIMVSGMGRLHDAITALKCGAWDYITKPIEDMAVLEHAVYQALERATLLRNNRRYHQDLEKTNQRLEQSLRQLKEDEEAGRKLQFQLLPENNKRYGCYQFSRHLHTSLYLSGDFVDYFYIDSQHLGFYIADVSGHGVPSAFVTVLLKSYMNRYLELYRQHKNEGILNPAKILKRLNHNVLSGGLDKYLTMFFGVINTTTNELRYANGGQFPPPVLCENDGYRFIGDKGLPVGLFDFAEYQTGYMPLPERFMISLISDGILETIDRPNLNQKLAFLGDSVCAARGSLETLIHNLQLGKLDPPPDDITLLLIQRDY